MLEQAAGNADLVPSVCISGGKTQRSNITKLGLKWLHRILIEQSQHFSKRCSGLERMYARISYERGKNTVRVAMATEKLKIIYSMLANNCPTLECAE